MKKSILLFAFLFALKLSIAQTYVSGGIYANTTWTKAASPYIVTDTVVVFPGVTLTIEPGVMVKFNDSTRLEIREAIINAIGTSFDSITFTSNSTSPKPSSWWGVHITVGKESDTMKFDYCNFHFADYGLRVDFSSNNVTMVKNSNFTNNVTGCFVSGSTKFYIDSSKFSNNSTNGLNIANSGFISNSTFSKNKNGIISYGGGGGVLINSLIDSNLTGIEYFRGIITNCDITNNEKGYLNPYGTSPGITMTNSRINNNSEFGITVFGDSVINCELKNNGTAIVAYGDFYASDILYNTIINNTIGIKITRYSNIKITCNKICSNTNFDIQYDGDFTHNINLEKNYFCTPDSASTRSKIFDGYVDVKYGLVNYMPLDTSCYKTLGVKENKVTKQSNTKLYPNPFSRTATLEFENPQNSSHHLNVFNTMGQLVMSIENIKGKKVLIDRKELPTGLYYYQLRNEAGIVGNGKMMIE